MRLDGNLFRYGEGLVLIRRTGDGWQVSRVPSGSTKAARHQYPPLPRHLRKPVRLALGEATA